MKLWWRHRYFNRILIMLMTVALCVSGVTVTTHATEAEQNEAALEEPAAPEESTEPEEPVAPEEPEEPVAPEEPATSEEPVASEEPEATPVDVASLQAQIDALPDTNEEGFAVNETNVQELSDQLSAVSEALAAYSMAGGDESLLDLTKFDNLTAAVMQYMAEHGEGGISTMSTADSGDWIAAAKTWIKGSHTADAAWDTYMGKQYFKTVSGSEDDSNWTSLSWQPPTAGIPAWDGTVAATPNTGNSQTDPQNPANANMIPYYDGTTQTFEVWSAAQLLYAFRWLQANGAANDPKGYTVHIMRDIDFNGSNGVLWPVDVVMPTNAMVTLDSAKADGKEANLFNLYMWRQTDAEAIAAGRTEGDGLGPTALIQTANAFFAKDLNFRGANIQGYGKETDSEYKNNGTAVLLGFGDNYTGTVTINTGFENISFEDTVVVARSSFAAALVGRDQGNNGSTAKNTHTMENCSSVRGYISGAYHTGGLAGSVNSYQLFDRCYAVETTVVTYGGHSGGLFACGGNSGCAVTNCFVDAKVYGLKQCGVFSGLMTGQALVFVNCYSSGFVEGTIDLGGFMGVLSNAPSMQVYFLNCYSTALVGLNSKGTNLGGFIGNSYASNPVLTMGNCYAAGEVGSASTYVKSGDATWPTSAHPTSETVTTPDYIGGFLGRTRASNNTNTYAWNCFYDKQTTAMREWMTGSALNSKFAKTSTAKYNSTYSNRVGCMANNLVGLEGALTTTAEKGGVTYTGLANSSGTNGFTGFEDNGSHFNDLYGVGSYPLKFQPSAYTYYGWNQTDDGHYPQLEVFQNAASNDKWDVDDQAIVAEYSNTSTSTVFLETWSKGLTSETGVLDNATSGASIPTTYDTVRDLTIRFDLTSSAGTSWYRIGDQEGNKGADANANGAKVTINGKTLDVLKLNLNSDGYYADEFHPGLEWMEVDYGNASRKLRVMPTMGIEAGIGTTLFRPSEKAPNSTKELAFYDHADDVELYYSTATRMADNLNDITTGIYPDVDGDGKYSYVSGSISARDPNELTSNQLALMPGDTKATLNTYFGTSGAATNDKYGLETPPGLGNPGCYPGIDASYMSRDQNAAVDATETNSANGSKLRVYARPIKEINVADGTFTPDDGNLLLDLTLTDLADALNGQGFLPTSVVCPYVLLEYIWELNDGRIVRDAKLLTIRNTPFSAEINAWDAGGLSDPVKLANNIKKTNDEDPGRKDSENGLADTDDTVVNVQKVLGPLEDVNVTATIQDPGKTDLTSGDARYNKPYGFGDPGNEAAHEYLYGSYTDDGGGDRPPDTIGPDYMDSLIASWEVNSTDKEVSLIRIRLDSGNVKTDPKDPEKAEKIYFEGEADPRYSNTITVKYEYYRYVTEENGQMVIVTEHKDRIYDIKQTTLSNGSTLYYIVFNHYDENQITDEGNEVFEGDVVNNVQVDLELSAKLDFEKEVQGKYGDHTKLFPFNLEITDDKREGLNTYNYQIYENGAPVKDSEGHVIGGTVTEGTEKTIQLKHGQSVHVIGLAYGSTYTLSEDLYVDENKDKIKPGMEHYTVTAEGDGVKKDAPDDIPYIEASLVVDPLPEDGNPVDGKYYTADRKNKFINTYQEVIITNVSLPNPFVIWLVIALTLLILLVAVLLGLWEKRRHAVVAQDKRIVETRGHRRRHRYRRIQRMVPLLIIGFFALSWNARPVMATDSADVNINATAHTIGDAPAEADTVNFTLSGTDSTTSMPPPMPTGAVGEDLTIPAVAEITEDFGNIHYTAAGIYTYMVSQSGSSSGYTYDTTTYEVTVAVANDFSVQTAYKNLTTGRKVENLEFWNRYNSGSTPVSVADLEVSIQVYGLVSADEVFQYKVEFTGPGAGLTYVYTDMSGTVLGQLTSGDIIPLTAGEKFIIKDIPIGTGWTVTQAQKPYYTINPTPGVLSGVIVEGENKAPFEATYDINTPAPVSIDPNVEKQVSGSDAPTDSVFTFSMTADDTSSPMPDGSSGGSKGINITGPGDMEFGWISYESEGTYTYTISEIKGSLSGYTYDEAVYHMKVIVTDDHGLLRAAIKIEKEKEGGTDKILFVNHYKKGNTPPGEPPGPGGDTSWAKPLNQFVTAVKTGDTQTLLPYLMLFIAALAVIILILSRRSRGSGGRQIVEIKEVKNIEHVKYKEEKK